jgi:hypothetical protein
MPGAVLGDTGAEAEEQGLVWLLRKSDVVRDKEGINGIGEVGMMIGLGMGMGMGMEILQQQ